MNKYALAILAVLLVAVAGQAQVAPKSVVAAQSRAEFRIKNLGFWVDGTFEKVGGTVAFDAGNLSASRIEAWAEVSSISTGIGLRDRHLQKEEYFDAEKHPRLTFTSTRFYKDAKRGLLATGTFTLKGIRKTVTLPVLVTKEGGYTRFSTTFEIDRRDYGVGGGGTLGSSVKITVTLATAP